MQKRINRFLRGILCLLTGRPEAQRNMESGVGCRMTEEALRGRVHKEKSRFAGTTISQRQCINLIEAVGGILKEEAAKRGMQVHIHVVHATDKSPTLMADHEPIPGKNRGP